MPNGKKKPKGGGRIIIETPLTAPETQADRSRRKLGVVDPYGKKWQSREFGLSHPALDKV